MMAAIVLLGIAALGGLVIAIMRFQGKPYPPMALALVHGVVAAAGLVMVILEFVNGSPAELVKFALGILVISALGGFVLFSFHLRKQALPIALVCVHAGAAVVAYLMLLKTVFAP